MSSCSNNNGPDEKSMFTYEDNEAILKNNER